jgi:hypothetical protein
LLKNKISDARKIGIIVINCNQNKTIVSLPEKSIKKLANGTIPKQIAIPKKIIFCKFL